MAGSGGHELFRKKSLERLSSPERLDQLLEVVDRKTWIPLATIGVLVAGIVGWAVFGRIPVRVEGRGMLVRPREVVAFHAPGAGRVARVAVEVGDRVPPGGLLVIIEQPELEAQLSLQRRKAAELAAESRAGSDGAPEADAAVAHGALAGPSLRDHIERSRALARRLRDERRAAFAEQERRLAAQEEVTRSLSDSLRFRLEGQRRLRDEDLVSQADLDALEEEYAESLERQYEIESQRAALVTARLEADEDYFDRLQDIAQWSFELKQQIADVHREIARLEVRIEETGRVRSDRNGRVLEINVAPGGFVEVGDRIGALEVSDPAAPLTSVTYFRVGDGKRLRPGMPIQVTPDTVERERYGSIRGRVRSVSRFPVSLEEAASVVGNRVLAQQLIEGGYLIEVIGELERSEEHPERYAWTSSGGAEAIEVSGGTTTRARVAVERERPIALVLPLLKSAAGLD
jgi:HlyD family secretion protein